MTKIRIAKRNQNNEINRENNKKIDNVKNDKSQKKNVENDNIQNDDIKNNDIENKDIKNIEEKYTVTENETEIENIDIINNFTDKNNYEDKSLLSSPLPISTSFSTSIPKDKMDSSSDKFTLRAMRASGYTPERIRTEILGLK